MKKNVNGNWDIIINKNWHSTFHTGKPGNFISWREVIWVILCHDPITFKLTEDESQCQKSVMVINILQMKCIRACPWSFWNRYIPAEIVVETWVKNCTARFHNHSIGMRSYLIKSSFKCNLQKHHFVYVYKVIIKCCLNFITYLYFSLALIK